LLELKQIANESIDIVITSPPYNINLKYRSYSDDLHEEEYLSWIYKIGQEISRILKPNGSFFLNIGSTNKLPCLSSDVCYTLRNGLFILQNDILWVKSITINDQSFGHFKPIKSPRFLNHTHEKIFHFSKNGHVSINRLAIGVPYQDKSNINRFNHSQDLRCRGNCWFIPYDTVQSKNEKYQHPATFPIELPKMCIALHGATPEMTVLDPFLGIGSTLIACQQLGIVNGIGFDIDPYYCEIAKKRLGIF